MARNEQLPFKTSSASREPAVEHWETPKGVGPPVDACENRESFHRRERDAAAVGKRMIVSAEVRPFVTGRQ